MPAYFDSQLGVSADRIVSFEQVGANYINYAPAPGAVGGPASRFAHIVYDVGSATVALDFVNLAASRNVAAIYVTNDNFCQALYCAQVPKDFNPFDTLPSYFDELALQVRLVNNQVPLPPSLLLIALGMVVMGSAVGSRRTTN
jgi:hypothetical protein